MRIYTQEMTGDANAKFIARLILLAFMQIKNNNSIVVLEIK